MKTLLPFIILFTLPIVFLVYGQETTSSIAERFESDGKKITELESGVILITDPELERLEKEKEKTEESIEKLEEEIKKYEKELTSIQTEKQTLQRDVKILDVNRERTATGINIIKGNIGKANIDLNIVDKDIKLKSDELESILESLIIIFQKINASEIETLPRGLLSYGDIFDVLERLESNKKIQELMVRKINQIKYLTNSLHKDKVSISRERNRLDALQRDLQDKEKVLATNIKKKQIILSETQSEESKYQDLLKQKKEERAELEIEILEFESQIDYIFDPTSIPDKGKGVLKIPFSVPARLTQGFGNTQFARQNSRHYGGAFHPGVDWGLSTGTKIFSSADGVVIGTGDTDIVRSCQSWGKWIAVEHRNGLTTLYAHLSHISVNEGDRVKSGALIGYSGNTGFSTGPHLHFGVYASSGFKIVPYENISNSFRCRGLSVPVAAKTAKFNPFDYLAR